MYKRESVEDSRRRDGRNEEEENAMGGKASMGGEGILVSEKSVWEETTRRRGKRGAT